MMNFLLLLNDSFNSFFAFNSYYNYTLRSSNYSIVRSDNCVSYCLAKDVRNNNLLTGSISNTYSTLLSDYSYF